MTMAPLVLALAAGAMSASYALCLRLAAGGINPALGASQRLPCPSVLARTSPCVTGLLA
jgi:hypothetical protein